MANRPKLQLAASRPDHDIASADSDELTISVPVIVETPDHLASRAAVDRGRFLARQDRWGELSRELLCADRARETTPAGTPIAELLAFGARGDVVAAAEHALQEGGVINPAPVEEGIAGLENELDDRPDDPGMILTVALGHIDLAWAWRAALRDGFAPPTDSRRAGAHFRRAANLLNGLCALSLNSALTAAARCAALPGQPNPADRMPDDYEDLIDLDPANPRHLRAFGTHLLPRWFGSYTALERESRRTSDRLSDIWGRAGYTWMWFDAIATDDGACACVDIDRFEAGLTDLMAGDPSQEMVNMLAAYTSLTIWRQNGSIDSHATRQRISGMADTLIRDHLSELHPLTWAHAGIGFDNSARISSVRRFAALGQRDAMQAIANAFRRELENGEKVVIGDGGPARAVG